MSANHDHNSSSFPHRINLVLLPVMVIVGIIAACRKECFYTSGVILGCSMVYAFFELVPIGIALSNRCSVFSPTIENNRWNLIKGITYFILSTGMAITVVFPPTCWLGTVIGVCGYFGVFPYIYLYRKEKYEEARKQWLASNLIQLT